MAGIFAARASLGGQTHNLPTSRTCQRRKVPRHRAVNDSTVENSTTTAARGRDRLELLTALIAAPGNDPLYRPDLIEIPRIIRSIAGDPRGGERVRFKDSGMCQARRMPCARSAEGRTRRAEPIAHAAPLTKMPGSDQVMPNLSGARPGTWRRRRPRRDSGNLRAGFPRRYAASWPRPCAGTLTD